MRPSGFPTSDFLMTVYCLLPVPVTHLFDPLCAGEKNALQEAIVGAVTAGPPELQAQVRFCWVARINWLAHQLGCVCTSSMWLWLLTTLPADHWLAACPPKIRW